MRQIIINAPDQLELHRLAESLNLLGCSINGTRPPSRGAVQAINQRKAISNWLKRPARRT